VISTKFPFYLYQHSEDYLAAGGLKGTAGLFNGSALFAVAGERLDDRTWHVIQHEGFHQFAAAVIGGDRPIWLNEGLAEYFGEALFTGDGFVSGVIPDWRRKRLCDEIQNGKLLSTPTMMTLSNAEWNGKITIANYDQAWSMVQFLAHGDGGKYQHAFSSMMGDLARGKQASIAWSDNFGDAAGFEDRWKNDWLNLPENPSADLYAQATVARLTSFLARATAQRQTFNSFEDFISAARSSKLKMSPTDWLPQDLLSVALADADDLIQSGATFALLTKPAPQIQCRLSNGTHCAGTFQLQRGLVVRTDVKLESKPGSSARVPAGRAVVRP
jgi:hypothetical protein